VEGKHGVEGGGPNERGGDEQVLRVSLRGEGLSLDGASIYQYLEREGWRHGTAGGMFENNVMGGRRMKQQSTSSRNGVRWSEESYKRRERSERTWRESRRNRKSGRTCLLTNRERRKDQRGNLVGVHQS